MYHSLRHQTLHYLARPHTGVRRQPLTGPSAWTGEQMRANGDWLLSLTPAEIEEIDTAVSHAERSGRPLRALTRDDFPLPALAPRIATWREEIRRGRGFVLIRGVPVQDWPAARAEFFFWGLGLHLGIPGAQNPQGDLLGHVRDQRGQDDVRLYRTNKGISVHCDAADVVGLLCLKPARSGGLSRIVSSVTVYNQLLQQAPELVDRLYQPIYFDTKGEGGLAAFPIAPCRHAAGELRTFWQADYFRSVDGIPGIPPVAGELKRLLDVYEAIAGRPELYLDMELQPGDVQLLSNHTILHARTAFEDHAEPERQRHLLRLWLSLPETLPPALRWSKRLNLAQLATRAVGEMLRQKLAA